MKAIFLGEISKKFEGIDVLADLQRFVFHESRYEKSLYNIKNNNCRTFAHTVAWYLGVEESYLNIVGKKKFDCA